MPKANLYNMAGEQVGEVELSEAVFGIEPNEVVLHAAIKNHLANCRQGTQSALTRAEVSGGGIKPWRQKGTGRARQGSIRAPQWYHGGIVFIKNTAKTLIVKQASVSTSVNPQKASARTNPQKASARNR